MLSALYLFGDSGAVEVYCCGDNSHSPFGAFWGSLSTSHANDKSTAIQVMRCRRISTLSKIERVSFTTLAFRMALLRSFLCRHQ
eukprot:1796383-Amphidinium_carterae.1